jgi:hypothetical protein
MYEESIKSVSPTSYQGVGGDLMFKKFGWFDDIKNVVTTNYCNLESKSVYYYWWGDLLKMFIDEDPNDIFKKIYMTNDSIIGFHWFRGVYLSKIYSIFLNYENKIHNFDFNGIIPKLTEYYKSIFNDFNIISEQKKISIVMSYVNRRKQLETTLKTIYKSKYSNFEIIIVNDSDEDLSKITTLYDNIKIINTTRDKTKKYTNPSISYNLGFNNASGDIILIQNPECCHIGDILSVVNCYLQPQQYLAFNTYYLDDYSKNANINDLLFNSDTDSNFWNVPKLQNIFKYLLSIKNDSVLPAEKKGWCSHFFYNKNYYHFCCAIYKEDLYKIGCFEENYKDGICFDDDEFIRKIKFSNIELCYFPVSIQMDEYPSINNFMTYAIHQHHDTFSYSDENVLVKFDVNKNLFISDHNKILKKYLLDKYENLNILMLNDYICKNISYDYNNKITVYNIDNYIKFESTIYELYNKYTSNGNSMIFEIDMNSIFIDSIYEVEITYDTKCLHNKIYILMSDNKKMFQKNGNTYKFTGNIDINNIKIVFTNSGILNSISCKIVEFAIDNKTKYTDTVKNVIKYI